MSDKKIAKIYYDARVFLTKPENCTVIRFKATENPAVTG